jgi:dsDNA-specific endonuclease/ATPase MutS2
MQEWREGIQKGLDQIKAAPNWKQAQRTNRDQMRTLVNELRQKIRVHREEFQLTFLATTNELEKDLKDFLTPIEDEFRASKSEAYKKAESDFENSRDELKDQLHAWRDRVKELRTPDTIIPY